MDLWWEGGGKRIMAVICTMLGFNKSRDLRNSGLGEKKKAKKKELNTSVQRPKLPRHSECPPLPSDRGMRSLKSSWNSGRWFGLGYPIQISVYLGIFLVLVARNILFTPPVRVVKVLATSKARPLSLGRNQNYIGTIKWVFLFVYSFP